MQRLAIRARRMTQRGIKHAAFPDAVFPDNRMVRPHADVFPKHLRTIRPLIQSGKHLYTLAAGALLKRIPFVDAGPLAWQILGRRIMRVFDMDGRLLELRMKRVSFELRSD